jgi:hypothetical protein
MKAYWGNGGIDLSITEHGTKMEVSDQLHAPAALPPGKIPWYSLDRSLGGSWSRPGRGNEEKNSQLLPRLEPPIIHPVTQRYTTELSWLYLQHMIM